MRTLLCVLMIVSLVTVAPVAAAEDAEEEELPFEGHAAAGKCYVINPFGWPPVEIYDCP